MAFSSLRIHIHFVDELLNCGMSIADNRCWLPKCSRNNLVAYKKNSEIISAYKSFNYHIFRKFFGSMESLHKIFIAVYVNSDAFSMMSVKRLCHQWKPYIFNSIFKIFFIINLYPFRNWNKSFF